MTFAWVAGHFFMGVLGIGSLIELQPSENVDRILSGDNHSYSEQFHYIIISYTVNEVKCVLTEKNTISGDQSVLNYSWFDVGMMNGLYCFDNHLISSSSSWEFVEWNLMNLIIMICIAVWVRVLSHR